MSILSNRMLAASRLGSYWEAVGLPWRWPVMPAIKACPRALQERYHSSEVSVCVCMCLYIYYIQRKGYSNQVPWQCMKNDCHSVSLGWPKLLWFVTESKHLSKPPRDWFPHIKDANSDTAYIEVMHMYYMSVTRRTSNATQYTFL